MDKGGAIHIVKRAGQRPIEAFQIEKLKASIEAACLSAGTAPGHAESIARSVVRDVEEWLATRPEVTSADLRREAVNALKHHHPDAAYLYDQHRITL
jgi:transcriptional regulator NrdR family protein